MNVEPKTILNSSRFHLPTLAALLLSVTLGTAYAVPVDSGTVSPVQAVVDPLKLPIVGKVMLADSTVASAKFDQTTLPQALAYVKANLPESKNNSKSQAVTAIDPAKLVLASKTSVQAIFVTEGASFHSTLGFNTTSLGVKTGNPEIIFPDISTSATYDTMGTKSSVRTVNEPLLPGDFVNLGTFNKGTALDFFLIAYGATGGSTVWNSASAASNPDKLQHVGIFTPNFFATPQLNSPYVFMTFEDVNGGGDKDYNDAIIAINVGVATVRSLFVTPEPSMYLTLGGFLALAIWAKRRMDRTATAI